MTSRLLLLAPRGDRLAGEVHRRLGRGALWLSEPGMSASFAIEPSAERCSGRFFIDGETVAWNTISALVVRPHPAWSSRRRFASVLEGFTAHEQRAGLCALMAAFPGEVANRLPPAWFIDRAVFALTLARDLARHLGVPHATGDSRAPDDGCVWISAGQILAGGPNGALSRAFADWLGTCSAALPDWQRRHAAHLVRVDGRRAAGGWAVRCVNMAPPLGSLRQAELACLADALIASIA